MKRKNAFILLAIIGASFLLYFGNVNLAGAQAADLEAELVTGAITVDGVGDEDFWDDATSQTFTLTAVQASNNTTPSVTLKAVYTATTIRILATWTDATKNNNKSEGDEDRIAIMIAMGTEYMESPCMNTSTNGATTSGEADQWHWKSARTDSGGASFAPVDRRNIVYNPSGSDKFHEPSGLTVPANSAMFLATSYSTTWDIGPDGGQIGDLVYYVPGTTIPTIANTTDAVKLVPMTHSNSFAENEFMDTVSRKRSGDSEYTMYGLDPGALSQYERYSIEAKGMHSGSSWTVEFERTLAAPEATIDAAFAAGESIEFAIAVYDGAVGDDHDDKRITTAWKTLDLIVPPAATPAIPGFPIEFVIAFSTIGLILIVVTKRR
jgi:hypothetical protein